MLQVWALVNTESFEELSEDIVNDLFMFMCTQSRVCLNANAMGWFKSPALGTISNNTNSKQH